MMGFQERSAAIKRAQRAIKALADHPETSRKQLSAALDQFNDCLRRGDPDAVWETVRDIETTASAIYGIPRDDEPIPRGAARWITPRGRGRPAKPRRPRQPPRT